jgi:DNA-binding NtrC family response regulator
VSDLLASFDLDETNGSTNWRRYEGPHQDAVYSPIPLLDPNPLVGESDGLCEVKHRVNIATQHDLNVLIRGESGTGENLIARTLHTRSDRKENWLIVVNCELTTAEDLKPLLLGSPAAAESSDVGGVFEIASGGTVVLDHVEALDAEAQARLNHILETHSFKRLGGSRSEAFGVRLLSIASVDLSRASFKADLYHKLAQFPISVPPLRARGDDVLRLARHVLRQRTERSRTAEHLSLSENAQEALRSHDWPGNVRQLQNVIERAANAASSSTIEEKDLLLPPSSPPSSSPTTESSAASSTPDDAPVPPDDPTPPSADPPSHRSNKTERIPTIEEMKEEATKRAYELCDGNVDQAAVELGIGRSTMYRMLKRYDIK